MYEYDYYTSAEWQLVRQAQKRELKFPNSLHKDIERRRCCRDNLSRHFFSFYFWEAYLKEKRKVAQHFKALKVAIQEHDAEERALRITNEEERQEAIRRNQSIKEHYQQLREEIDQLSEQHGAEQAALGAQLNQETDQALTPLLLRREKAIKELRALENLRLASSQQSLQPLLANLLQ